MFSDSRGQISAELILLVGLIFVFVLALSTYFGQTNELNTAMAAAKNGFINASNDISYTGYGNVIRLNSINYTGSTITVKYYSTLTLNPTNTYYIESSMLNSIASALNTPVQGNNSTNPGYVKTGRYNYTVTLVPS